MRQRAVMGGHKEEKKVILDRFCLNTGYHPMGYCQETHGSFLTRRGTIKSVR